MLMIRKPNALGMGEIHFKTHLNTFASNVFLILKTMNFQNISLAKLLIFMLLKAWMHNINYIDQDIIKN
jgi:hypothetical protein